MDCHASGIQDLVKAKNQVIPSKNTIVIPAEAGIKMSVPQTIKLDSSLRWNDS